MQELIDRAKEKFKNAAAPSWRLNEHVLEVSIDRFKALLDEGLLENEEQVIKFSLVMATEFEGGGER